MYYISSENNYEVSFLPFFQKIIHGQKCFILVNFVNRKNTLQDFKKLLPIYIHTVDINFSMSTYFI